MMFRKAGRIMAVKRIRFDQSYLFPKLVTWSHSQHIYITRSTVDEKEQKQLLMDLKVVMDSSDCPYIVQFYGAIFKEGDCWICMELMDSSLDKFYHFIFDDLQQTLPEAVIGELS